MWAERLDVIGWFLVLLLVARAIWRMADVYFHGEGDDFRDKGDTGDIGLGEDAGVPAADDLRAGRRARPDDLARIGVAHAALRLRMERKRLEARQLQPFLCGVPEDDDPLGADSLTADRLKSSSNRCA